MRARCAASVLFVALGGAGVLAATTAQAGDPAPGTTTTVVVTVQGEYEGLPAWRWAARSRSWHRQYRQADRNADARARTVRRLRRTLAHSPTVDEALELARVVYGVDLGRRVRCESHGSPGAHNKSGASGLLQFLPSTWRTTPFAGLSVWSPYAAALAGGWMIRAGRSGEWSCSL